MSIIYRKSKQGDESKIDELLNSCFGDRSKYGAVDNIDDRYLLAFDGDELVAMTGISSMSLFNGYEIDWTCVSPTYRHGGLVTEMIKTCMNDVEGVIYCSCLRLHNNERINLYHAMQTLGFKLVLKGCKSYDSNHMKACDDCIYRIYPNCVCYEDLYVKN